MEEQYLIAHKIDGKPTFEVAEPMKCPLCEDGVREGEFHCDECGGEGIWWVTHYGHRAYPYWVEKISEIIAGNRIDIARNGLPPMPADLPEHFWASAAPKGKGIGLDGRSILEKLGLAKPLEPMRRW